MNKLSQVSYGGNTIESSSQIVFGNESHKKIKTGKSDYRSNMIVNTLTRTKSPVKILMILSTKVRMNSRYLILNIL